MENKYRVQVLLRKSEREVIKAAAEKAGLALAAYIRMAALKEAQRNE